MKIAIIGLGSVALADALAFARLHQVVMTGPVPDRVDAINGGDYALNDPALSAYCAAHDLNLRATLNTQDALDGADIVFVSAPLSQDPENGDLRLVELESRIEFVLRALPLVPVVIRSAVPVGFTDRMRAQMNTTKLIYAPEFGQQGRMLRDLLRPDFVIVGECSALGARVADLLLSVAQRADVPLRLMSATDAEAMRHMSTLLHPQPVVQTDETPPAPRPIRHGIWLDTRIAQLADHLAAPAMVGA